MNIKFKAQQLFILITTALTSGCVGYNHTLFMTKSNAGLDFDSTPPTAEVNISRKEAVVAPSFEGGQTPPVMASFGSNTGTGAGVGRFFFGVDQTFAGGDAAVTMAKLYDKNEPTEPEETLRAKFDSSLKLSQLPNANKTSSGLKRFFFGLPGPGEVRPFIFGTDSQLGLKIGWNGVGGPYPDNLKIGYNRKEFAYAPVTITPHNSDAAYPYRVRMPSFLATVDSNVEGGSDVKVGWMQYFATGDAANQLARKPAVRTAMLKRADPGQAPAIDAARIAAAKDTAQKLIEQQNGKISQIVVCVSNPDGSINAATMQSVSEPAFRAGEIDKSVFDFLNVQPDATTLRSVLEDTADAAIEPLFKGLPDQCSP